MQGDPSKLFREMQGPIFRISHSKRSTISGMDTKEWYVLHNKPGKEAQVDMYLRSRGIETFYPTLEVIPVNPRASRIRPYFPGYLFVRVHLQAVGISTLQWIPGAVGLVSFGSEPAVVPEHIISQLQHRIKALQASHTALKPGDVVRITSGPFAGHEAIFDLRLRSSERVRLLLDLLGRTVKVNVNARTIEKKQ